MAIFGINFNDFGSRKLRFDSQKRGLVFNGRNNSDRPFCIKYGIPDPNEPPIIKYACPPAD